MPRKRLSVSFESTPLRSVGRTLSDFFGVGVVFSDSLDSREITAELINCSVEESLAVVARRVGAQATRSGQTWFLGELLPEDRAYMVRRVSRADAQSVSAAITTLLSQFGRQSVMPDGVAIVADRLDVLQRVGALLDTLAELGGETWCVQLHLVSQSSEESDTLGIAGMPTATVASSLIKSGGAWTDALSVSAQWSALLAWSWSARGSAVVASPMLLLSPGSQSVIRDGLDLRIPQQTVSDQGTVTTTGYSTVQTGLTLECLLRDLGGDQARLQLKISLDDVVGFVDDKIPIVARQSLETSPVVNADGVFLLGSLTRSKNLQAIEAPLGRGTTDETRVVKVWARVIRVKL